MANRLNHWLLAVLLVISQAALLVHEADVAHHVDGEDCQVCLVASGHDDLGTVESGDYSSSSDAPLALLSTGDRPISAHKFVWRARAPPINTLHV
jgi:hypothetical protein